MLTHYLTIGWRNLRRNPLYSFINILGLSIGVAACLLIFLFVQDELTFDRFHGNQDRIYRVIRSPKPNMQHFELNEGKTPYMPGPLAQAVKEEIPTIANSVRLRPAGKATILVDNHAFKDELTYTDSSIFDIFSFTLAAGDPRRALTEPTAVVLSRKAAIKYFGTEDAIGRYVDISLYDAPPKRHQVTGILNDFPPNTSIKMDVVAPMISARRSSNLSGTWKGWNFYTYLMLNAGADPVTVGDQISALYERRLAEAESSDGIELSQNPFLLSLQPLADVHLDPETGESRREYSYILGCIAVAVLLLACINFITLAMARSTTRSREVSVRKVFGAVRGQLINQFCGEGLLVSGCAIVAGFVLAELALPVFNSIAEKSLSIDLLSNFPLIFIAVGLLLILGLVSGAVPAFMLSGLHPAAIFRQRSGLLKSGLLPRGLMVLQYGISIALLICLLGMFAQYRFINSKQLGFNSEHVVVITNTSPPTMAGDDLLNRMRRELASAPSVLSISGCDPSFVRGWGQTEWPYQGTSLRTFVYTVDHEYIPTLGMQLLQGRNFDPAMPSDPTQSVIVNESFVRKAGLTDPIGAPLTGYTLGDSEQPPLIVGVLKDYHVVSLHKPIEPVMLTTDPSLHFSHILVRVDGANLKESVDKIESTWSAISEQSRFDYSFLDEDLARQYLEEQKWMKIVGYSAMVAIIIASLGLFGLAGLSAVRRMKEVGIRKVLGASLPQLLENLNREFLLLVGVANLIAWPLAYLVLNQWLQSFAYRTELSVWIFILSGLSALVLALAVISYHTVRTASINPSEVLRHE